MLLENSNLKKDLKDWNFSKEKMEMNKTNFYEDLYLKNDAEHTLNNCNVYISLHKKKRTFRDT